MRPAGDPLRNEGHRHHPDGRAGAGLPRTGVELTALLAAAGLLAFGTAVVAFTRRTKKQ
ncbi:hypothetical protein CJ198_06830 [Brevibacterium luteolum]|uniref:Gram-positive cocci surface proteins LPxTG domain-containing protein n=1 Tax=Brevibacterium luteolum TaxID=199591 RepID=A0A2N6PI36_9MICO|nr:hypothetical protein CJ198_06830 [Brevibacterium luteolum]